MRNLAIALTIMVLTALAASALFHSESQRSRCAADSLQAVLDSTRAKRDTAVARHNRILAAYDELTGKVAEADTQMTRYAAIVARDPSQAVFLRGWTRRAFADLFPQTKP